MQDQKRRLVDVLVGDDILGLYRSGDSSRVSTCSGNQSNIAGTRINDNLFVMAWQADRQPSGDDEYDYK